LQYDKYGGSHYTGIANITNTNTGTCKTITVSLPDAAVGEGENNPRRLPDRLRLAGDRALGHRHGLRNGFPANESVSIVLIGRRVLVRGRTDMAAPAPRRQL
jgi:hypothetical protein